MDIFLFPDTAVLLNFPSPREIDWRALCGSAAGRITIAVSATVFRELARYAESQKQSSVRDRAIDVLYLDLEDIPAGEGKPLPAGIEFVFLKRNFAHELANRTMFRHPGYNHALAAMIETKAAHPGARVALVTADPLFSAVADRYVEIIRMPESLRLGTGLASRNQMPLGQPQAPA